MLKTKTVIILSYVSEKIHRKQKKTNRVGNDYFHS